MQTKLLKSILEHFELEGDIIRLEKFGSGNINDTYLSVVDGNPPQWYIHQRINHEVFPQPIHVIENIALVTNHIREKLRHDSPESRKITLEMVPTGKGELFYLDPDGGCWRTTIFIPDAVAYDTVQNPKQAYEAGKILGEFQRLVVDIPPEELHDTLPGFHHTPLYYQSLLEAVETPHPDPAIDSRKQEPVILNLLQEIRKRESLVPVLMQAYHSGELCKRVVHNDPKINNILFDCHSQQGIGMIDLDTVKGGLIHFDYGDCLRSAANPAGEEVRDTRQVNFDLSIFEKITQGYLEETSAFLTSADMAALADAIKIMTFEMIIRFLADYLKGDVYFKKISYPTQNLNRSRVQFALLEDIEKKERQIRRILRELLCEA